MALNLITCIFPAFCSVFESCTENQLAVPTEIRARIQDGVSIAEFWTPGSPEHLPWPAVVTENTFGKRSWTLFTAGELSGAWMMTVDRDTGVARLSSHFDALLGNTDMAAARGNCTIQEEEA